MSLYESHPSMGKILERRGIAVRSVAHEVAEGKVELEELKVRKGNQKALEKDNGFAKAGVEIVMDSLERLPVEVFFQRTAVVEFAGDLYIRIGKIGDQIQKYGEFVLKLGFVGEEQLAKERINARCALAASQLKIVGG